MWTSYSTVYMIIKNEVKVNFSDENLTFIIVTTSSYTGCINDMSHAPSPPNKSRMEGHVSSAMYRTPNLIIGYKNQ